jgi:alkylation response protein AidB-like acyl-CoA dehydrogenase
MVKTVAANMYQRVVDRAMQTHGAMGMTNDTPLVAMFGYARILRIADGPDEVHNQVVARRELKRAAQLKTAAIPA